MPTVIGGFWTAIPIRGAYLSDTFPNIPSGGRGCDIEIGKFLVEEGYGPQHNELLRLIGTLIEERSDA